ncbi:MAG: type III pantothenate kinase [Anaerolineae bacterium]|nr:type III pantothenate kinase [Anaerolineae bacterium]
MASVGVLCLDVGNTNIVFGVIGADGEVLHQWRIATDAARMPDEYAVIMLSLLHHTGIEPGQLDGMAISSVVPSLTSDFIKLGRRYLDAEPLVIRADTPSGLNVLYDDPRQVGADRIVNCVSVKERFGGPACVIDFGTATTFDALDAAGDYLGGAIAPGVLIAAEALYSRAARLVKVELSRPPAAVGRNTEQSIQAGMLYGYVGLVEGLVARFRNELGEGMRVVATGGLADMIAAETPVIELVDPTLTLDGLYRIYRRNRGG